jgi:hypothetical protein
MRDIDIDSHTLCTHGACSTSGKEVPAFFFPFRILIFFPSHMGHAPHDAGCGATPLLCSQRPAKESPSFPCKALFGYIQIHPTPHGLGEIEMEFVRSQTSPNRLQQLS